MKIRRRQMQLLHLQSEKTRHGKIVYYVRIKPFPRIRIKGQPFGEEFKQNYRTALNNIEPHVKQKRRALHKEGSLGWLVAQFTSSAHWLRYAKTTQKHMTGTFNHLLDSACDVDFRSITRRDIIMTRDSKADQPGAAGHYMRALSAVFKFALDMEYVDSNPVQGVKNLPLSGGGHKPWTLNEVKAYQAHWLAGTKERVWFDVLLYTGLRCSDAVRLGDQHIKGRFIKIKTQKSRKKVEVCLPFFPELAVSLQEGKVGESVFICGNFGRALKAGTFSIRFSKAAQAAGVFKTAHGLRKYFATRLIEAGATNAQAKTTMGWTKDEQINNYTREANKEILADEVAGRALLLTGNG